ncbi:hypothetical protein QWI17_09320 [Gilvimarinus sp. SDUM040013]|uniref:Uncharacterized protein n=1 Tax=Gilvimarinus gilvus TaxID=3058038 RepID=A0ABU4S3N8_9GAMM|nr:hypothetical protein [Gilvimarinus sp. SDUM040013]MDO3386035.1 hypothetical protein [Gilvimarinus sp. SDUM040013]MDX6850488.1 hypothetical protein [Gilvimarinus sp. SDUM040013]
MSTATASIGNSQSTVYPNYQRAVGECITQYASGGLARFVVRSIRGIQVFSDFDMTVRSSEVIATLFDIESGSAIHAPKEAA